MLLILICLSDEANIPIFDKTRDEYKDIGRNISFCLCEKIEDIDGYPRNICKTCYTTVNDIIAFQNKYKESCEILTQSLKQTLELSCIKEEFEELSNHSIISNLDLGSVKSESKIVFRDAEQFKELIQPLVTNVKEKPKTKKRDIAKLAAKSEPLVKNVKKEPKTRKRLKHGTNIELVQPLASNVPRKRKRDIAKPTSNNNNTEINSKQVNSRIFSSILEGEFHFTGEQWCLKAPNKKLTKPNHMSGKNIDKEPNMVQKDVSPTCKDVPMLISKTKTNESRLCELCGSTFENINKLKNHVNSVHLKTPSKCPSCPKILFDNAALRKHIKRCHTKEFKCVCPICGKGFVFGGDLNHHHKTVHLKIKNSRKFPCKYCDKEFTVAKSLLMHERSVHTGERPEVCSVCDARFTHKDYLKEHMRLHTGEKPFKCPVCARGYAQRSNMKSHIKHGHRISQLTETMLKTIKPNYLRLMKP